MSNIILNKIVEKSPHLSWIKDNTIFLTLHGSRAYGTNTATSDYDYKGVCIPTKEYYLGYNNRFEQAELKDPDSVIYEISKFFNLAAASNPNIIEVLYTDPSDHVMVSPVGEKILDIKNEFLSKRIKHTFSGYAFSQLKRIKSHRKWLLNPPKERPTRKEMGLPEQTLIPQDQLMAASAEIQKELDKFQFDFLGELSESMKISIRNIMANMLAELQITSEDQWLSAARKVGLNDNFIEIMQLERAYTSRKKDWDQYQEWKLTRNPERAADESKYGVDLKHAYHLVRLIRMAKEILSTGKVLVKRPDREELLEIRNGAWNYDKIIDFVEKEEKILDELYLTTTILPKIPNHKKLDELCISLIEDSLIKSQFIMG